MTDVRGTSGQCYRLVPVSSAGTIESIASNAGLSVPKGGGFYEVSKKEDVSANKEMLLLLGNSGGAMDNADARAKLGIGAAAKASVTPALVASKAGAGAKLFVQSTSANRGLTAGTQLCVKVDGPRAAGAAAATAAAAAKPSAKTSTASKSGAVGGGGKARARKAAEIEEEDEKGEEDEEEEEADKKPSKAKRQKGAAVSAVTPPAAAASDAGGVVRQGGYVFVPVGDVKQTVDDLASAHGIAVITGYYEVGGKTEVSANKSLVLVTGGAPGGLSASAHLVDDVVEIRRTLAMGSGKASINSRTVQSMAGPEARLFVESTSGNRGLIPGTMLCAKEHVRAGAAEGAGGAAAAAAGSPVSLAQLFAAHFGESDMVAPAAAAAAGAVGATTTSAARSNGAKAGGKKAKAVKGGKKGKRGGDDDDDDGGDDDDDDGDDPDDGDGGPPGGGGGGAGGPYALDPYALALQAVDFGFFLREGLNFPELFPLDSVWSRRLDDASGGPVQWLVDEPPSAAQKASTVTLFNDVRALGFAQAGPEVLDEDAVKLSQEDGKKSKTPAPTAGWFRDGRLERRVRAQLRQAQPHADPLLEGGAGARIRAWVHSSAPASIGLVLVSGLAMDDGEGGAGNDVLLLTRGPRFVVVAVLGAHPLVVTEDVVYENSDGSGPGMIRTPEYIALGFPDYDPDNDDDGEGEEGGEGMGPAAAPRPATNLDDVAELFQIAEKYWRAFTNDKFH